MPSLFWISLFVLLFSLTAGSIYLFVRALKLWRTFKTFGSALDGVVRELTGSLERLSANAEAFGSQTPKLKASIDRLRHSLARAAVLRTAVQDAQDAFDRLTAVYPRK
jgi:hypothetical protein